MHLLRPRVASVDPAVCIVCVGQPIPGVYHVAEIPFVFEALQYLQGEDELELGVSMGL